jgi:hypothetical protein
MEMHVKLTVQCTCTCTVKCTMFVYVYSKLYNVCVRVTDISQYRLRFGFSLLFKTVFHLNCLTAQLSYEGRAAVERAK